MIKANINYKKDIYELDIDGDIPEILGEIGLATAEVIIETYEPVGRVTGASLEEYTDSFIRNLKFAIKGISEEREKNE